MAQIITEKPLYIAIQYFYHFLVVNIHFMIANLLFLTAYFLIEVTVENILVFYIALLPAGPSLVALYASMDKLIRQKDLRPTKDFWKYYRDNFAIKILVTTVDNNDDSNNRYALFELLSSAVFTNISYYDHFFIICYVVCHPYHNKI